MKLKTLLTMKTKYVIALGLVGIGTTLATPAHAGLSIGISIGIPCPLPPVMVAPALPQVIYAPVPAPCRPPPVVVQPALPVFRPPAVIIPPPPIGRPVAWMPPGHAKKLGWYRSQPDYWRHRGHGNDKDDHRGGWSHGRDRH